MAITSFTSANSLTRKAWSARLFEEVLKTCWSGKFMGEGSDSLCQIKTELKKDKGDQITVGLRMQLTGDGVSGDAVLEGNEEALTFYSDALIIDQLRWAVRNRAGMTSQRVLFDLRMEAKEGLRDWWAGRLDYWFFNQLCGNTAQTDVRYTGMQAAIAPDTNHRLWQSISTTSIANDESLTSTDVFNLTLIDRAVVRAKTLDNIATTTGAVPIRPIMVGGDPKYVLFLHPYQVYQLRTNTNTGQWLDIQKAAITGGQISKNPIYTGAMAEYNGCVIHEAFRIANGIHSTTGAAQTNVRRAVLCGAQAAIVAFGAGSGPTQMSWDEETFDYEELYGVKAGMIAGLKKTRFNSLDFGVLTLSSYSPAP